MHVHKDFLLWHVLVICIAVVCSRYATDDDVATLNNEITALKGEVKSTSKQLETVQRQLEAVLNKLGSSSLAISTKSLESIPLPRDCADVMSNDAKTSGVYTVYVGIMKRPVHVYCDMTTDGGGWTLFQRRQDGSVNFYRNWADYENGFGNVIGEHWLGNDILHRLTNGRTYRLRVDLGDWYGNARYAEYSNFRVASACEKYKMVSLGAYCGTAGDSLSQHAGHMFSTLDQDNDSYGSGSCAASFKGGWWYLNCHDSNLNGLYLKGPHTSYADGVEWRNWTGYHYSLKFTEMKIRPVDM